MMAYDSSIKLSVIMMVVQHLPCKAKPSAEKGIPCPHHDTSSHRGIYTVNSPFHACGMQWRHAGGKCGAIICIDKAGETSILLFWCSCVPV